MNTAFTSLTWEEATKGYLIHLTASGRAKATVRFYRSLLAGLTQWAEGEAVALERFGKRHLDAYLAGRVDFGISQTTLHSDAVAAKAFFKWCARNDVVERSPLAEYVVRKAPRPSKYKPSDEDMKGLFGALRTFWDPSCNTDARFLSASKRSFHRERNYSIMLVLVDSACRIGEALNLKVEHVSTANKTIHIAKAKGRQPRDLPISQATNEALTDWLRVRKRVMSEAGDTDEGWFLSASPARGLTSAPLGGHSIASSVGLNSPGR
jgi:site-specific recombinase XerD